MAICAQLRYRLNRFVLKTVDCWERQRPFWLMRFLFAMNGISLEFECGVFWRIAWKVHRALICLHSMIYITDQCVKVYTVEGRFEKRLFNVHFILVSLAIMMRQLCMAVKIDSFKVLRGYTMGNDFLKNDEDTLGKRMKTWKFLKRLELGMVCQASVQYVIFVLTGVEKLVSIQFPFDFNETSRILQYVFQNMYSLYYAWHCSAVALNCYVLIALMSCLITELQIVVDAFGTVFQDSLQPRQEYRFDMTKQDISNFWNSLQANIRKCCQQHVKFIQMINEFKQFTTQMFLLIYGAALALTAIEIYQALSTTHLGFYEIMILQDTVIFYLEFFCFCWLTTKMNDLVRSNRAIQSTIPLKSPPIFQNAQISDRIYEQQWYEEMQYGDGLPVQYRSVKQSLLIVMANAQQSLGISVGGVYELSLELFVSLLNNSYSTLMFLLEVIRKI